MSALEHSDDKLSNYSFKILKFLNFQSTITQTFIKKLMSLTGAPGTS